MGESGSRGRAAERAGAGAGSAADRGPAGPTSAAGRAQAAPSELAAEVRRALRTYPDFPRPGILFRDIAPVLADPALLGRITDRLAAVAREVGADKVAGIESRGFLLGAPVAVRLALPFVPIRKQGKLPGQTVHATYELEYGTARLEMQTEAVGPGDRLLLVDDLLATGGTAAAAAGLIRALRGEVAGIAFLIELTALSGRAPIEEYNIFTILAL